MDDNPSAFGKIVEIVRPLLHHAPALGEVLRVVVGGADFVAFVMGKLAFDPIGMKVGSFLSTLLDSPEAGACSTLDCAEDARLEKYEKNSSANPAGGGSGIGDEPPPLGRRGGGKSPPCSTCPARRGGAYRNPTGGPEPICDVSLGRLSGDRLAMTHGDASLGG
jgi:hypothetical protein